MSGSIWFRRLRSAFDGGAALLLATFAALVLANSPLAESYAGALAVPLGISFGSASYVLPLSGWIDDGLMATFFLLVGLEIRRELLEGQLASLPRAAAPVVAAVGGMVLPAAIYIAFTRNDSAALRGWAVPVATDIAFSLAALRALGRRVPAGLRVFLSALAIIDDLAAIVVIALFYTSHLDGLALVAGAAVLLGLAVLNRAGVRALAPYLIGFGLLWACLARSGIHPTLAGVAIAFVVPMADSDGTSPAYQLERWLSGWVSFLVLPLFGFANAGLRLGDLSWHMLADPVVPGILLGLFIGKQAGVFGATWAGAKLRVIHLPAQLSARLLYGAALLCGIGFTMSLFIGHLAFADAVRLQELKASVLAASLLSAVSGVAVLAWATGGRSVS